MVQPQLHDGTEPDGEGQPGHTGEILLLMKVAEDADERRGLAADRGIGQIASGGQNLGSPQTASITPDPLSHPVPKPPLFPASLPVRLQTGGRSSDPLSFYHPLPEEQDMVPAPHGGPERLRHTPRLPGSGHTTEPLPGGLAQNVRAGKLPTSGELPTACRSGAFIMHTKRRHNQFPSWHFALNTHFFSLIAGLN